jgi:hypothetical protein
MAVFDGSENISNAFASWARDNLPLAAANEAVVRLIGRKSNFGAREFVRGKDGPIHGPETCSPELLRALRGTVDWPVRTEDLVVQSMLFAVYTKEKKNSCYWSSAVTIS